MKCKWNKLVFLLPPFLLVGSCSCHYSVWEAKDLYRKKKTAGIKVAFSETVTTPSLSFWLEPEEVEMFLREMSAGYLARNPPDALFSTSVDAKYATCIGQLRIIPWWANNFLLRPLLGCFVGLGSIEYCPHSQTMFLCDSSVEIEQYKGDWMAAVLGEFEQGFVVSNIPPRMMRMDLDAIKRRAMERGWNERNWKYHLSPDKEPRPLPQTGVSAGSRVR